MLSLLQNDIQTKDTGMRIHFDNDQIIFGELNKSVLEVALEQGVPLMNACKGKARCSTCRVLVLKGDVSHRNAKEQELADRLGLPDNVRLSCQYKPTSDVHLRRIVMDDVDQQILNRSNSAEEKELAILFSDIRAFTTFSEQHLPHDIVHILNRYNDVKIT